MELEKELDLSSRDREALELFFKAGELEKAKRLDDAILEYRKAFSLNDHIDLLARKIYQSRNQNNTINMDAVEGEDKGLEKTTESSPVQESLLDRLPKEIVIQILSQLALISPKEFVKTMLSSPAWHFPFDSTIFWEPLCRHQWPEDHQLRLGDYGYSYYRQFRERPVVRLDGVFIAASKYWRQGEQRNGAWQPPMLEVTYYRYLRFFEDGTVHVLLANDPPKLILSQFLEQTHRLIQHGVWTFDDTANMLYLDTEGTTKDFDFHMEYKIVSSGGRLHNKLRWSQYYCIERLSGERADFGVEQERSFFFHKCSIPEISQPQSHEWSQRQHQTK